MPSDAFALVREQLQAATGQLAEVVTSVATLGAAAEQGQKTDQQLLDAVDALELRAGQVDTTLEAAAAERAALREADAALSDRVDDARTRAQAETETVRSTRPRTAQRLLRRARRRPARRPPSAAHRCPRATSPSGRSAPAVRARAGRRAAAASARRSRRRRRRGRNPSRCGGCTCRALGWTARAASTPPPSRRRCSRQPSTDSPPSRTSR